MARHVNLAQYEQENSLMFGLKWSLVGFALALCFLAGCSSMFDQRIPRYNTVDGPRRPPPLNPNAANAAVDQSYSGTAAPVAQAAPAVQAAPVAPTAPVAQAPAQAYMPQKESPAWWDVTSWFDEEAPQPMMSSPRVVPQENLSAIQSPTVQAVPAPVVATSELPDPVLPPSSAALPDARQASDTRAEIVELERELEQSNREREALMKETGTAMPAPAPQAVPPVATMQPAPVAAAPEVIDSSEYDVNYKVVRLPPPPPRDAVAPTAPAVPVVTGRDVYYATDPMKPTPELRAPVAVTAPAVEAPVAEASAASAALPAPIYTPLPEAEREAMAPIKLVAPTASPEPVDVPLAPAVDYGSPVLSSSAAPIQLTPPARGGFGYRGEGYLEDSRYSGRRAGTARGAY